MFLKCDTCTSLWLWSLEEEVWGQGLSLICENDCKRLGVCNRYIVSAQSLTLPQFIDRLKPEYGMYKLPFVPLPFWVTLNFHPVLRSAVVSPAAHVIMSVNIIAVHLLCCCTAALERGNWLRGLTAGCEQVIWIAITLMGSKVFDVELLRCTVGKVTTDPETPCPAKMRLAGLCDYRSRIKQTDGKFPDGSRAPVVSKFEGAGGLCRCRILTRPR